MAEVKDMPATDTQDTPLVPQTYLITPPEFELSTFPDVFARVLDSNEIACVRLSMATQDEDRICRAADALRAICHERDIAIVMDKHIPLVERLGLDGVHLGNMGNSVRNTRKELGPDAIIGAYCGHSQHDGMTAGEAGADYIAFGPVGLTPLGDGSRAELDLFQWWSEMIEVPVVAEGALDADLIAALAPFTDFFGVGPEIWSHDAPAESLNALLAPLRG